MAFHGWSIHNGYDIRLKIFLDNEPVENYSHNPRPDVYNAYAEDYAGFLNKDTIGWSFEIPYSELSLGNHIIKVQLIDKESNIIEEKESEFTIE